MPFVTRDKDKKIIGLASTKQYPEQEFLEPDNANVVAFRNRSKNAIENQAKIRAEIKQTAIDSLKQKGELPQDYPDVQRISS